MKKEKPPRATHSRTSISNPKGRIGEWPLTRFPIFFEDFVRRGGGTIRLMEINRAPATVVSQFRMYVKKLRLEPSHDLHRMAMCRWSVRTESGKLIFEVIPEHLARQETKAALEEGRQVLAAAVGRPLADTNDVVEVLGDLKYKKKVGRWTLTLDTAPDPPFGPLVPKPKRLENND